MSDWIFVRLRHRYPKPEGNIRDTPQVWVSESQDSNCERNFVELDLQRLEWLSTPDEHFFVFHFLFDIEVRVCLNLRIDVWLITTTGFIATQLEDKR